MSEKKLLKELIADFDLAIIKVSNGDWSRSVIGSALVEEWPRISEELKYVEEVREFGKRTLEMLKERDCYKREADLLRGRLKQIKHNAAYSANKAATVRNQEVFELILKDATEGLKEANKIQRGEE